MGVYAIADLHFGHRNMAIKRGFSDEFAHDEYLIKCWNSVIKKKDTVWVLGDVTMEKSKSYYKLNELNGIKNVVLGNHDRRQDVKKLLNYVNSVCGMVIDRERHLILTHCPIHESEIRRDDINVHGHIHEKIIDSPRYRNVSAEVLLYKPILLDSIKLTI